MPDDGAGRDLHAGRLSSQPTLPARKSTHTPVAISKIASILIKGQALGTPGVGGDNFGFVAEHLISLSVAGITIPLNPGANSGGNFFNLNPNDDVTVRELT